jgi:hypothetical protein
MASTTADSAALRLCLADGSHAPAADKTFSTEEQYEGAVRMIAKHRGWAYIFREMTAEPEKPLPPPPCQLPHVPDGESVTVTLPDRYGLNNIYMVHLSALTAKGRRQTPRHYVVTASGYASAIYFGPGLDVDRAVANYCDMIRRCYDEDSSSEDYAMWDGPFLKAVISFREGRAEPVRVIRFDDDGNPECGEWAELAAVGADV